MGKKIMKVSKLTGRSFLSFYNKIVTLIFALFCVAAGFSSKSVSKNASEPILKGKVLNGTDSTILKNVKIYLCGVAYPVYGMGFYPSFNLRDSTASDSLGNFEFPFPDNKYYGDIAIVKNNSSDSHNFSNILAYTFHPTANTADSFMTAYLKPIIYTGIIEKTADKTSESECITVTYGRIITIKIADHSPNEKYSARIVNLNGEQIDSPANSGNGVLVWNTEKIAKGIYILDVRSKDKQFTSRISVK